jgi:hypothetical protein
MPKAMITPDIEVTRAHQRLPYGHSPPQLAKGTTKTN